MWEPATTTTTMSYPIVEGNWLQVTVICRGWTKKNPSLRSHDTSREQSNSVDVEHCLPFFICVIHLMVACNTRQYCFCAWGARTDIYHEQNLTILPLLWRRSQWINTMRTYVCCAYLCTGIYNPCCMFNIFRVLFVWFDVELGISRVLQTLLSRYNQYQACDHG